LLNLVHQLLPRYFVLPEQIQPLVDPLQAALAEIDWVRFRSREKARVALRPLDELDEPGLVLGDGGEMGLAGQKFE
jgi:hypothetical protein